MKNVLLPFLVLICFNSSAQSSFFAEVKDAVTREPLVGANVIIEGTQNGASADMEGIVEIKNFPDGRHVVIISMIGYTSIKDTIDYPAISGKTYWLAPESGEIGEVIVEATRSNKSID